MVVQWFSLVQCVRFTQRFVEVLTWCNAIEITQWMLIQWFLMFPWKWQKWLDTTTSLSPGAGPNRPGGHPGSSASCASSHQPRCQTPQYRFHAPSKLVCCFLCSLLPVLFWLIGPPCRRTQLDRRFLCVAAGACTWTYVRAVWLKEMAPYLRQETAKQVLYLWILCFYILLSN